MPQYAHIVVTFSKIWEDYVEVKWGRELFDGAKLKRYHLLATAENYKIERLFEPGDSTYRLVGLAPGSEVKVSMRAQFDGGEWGNWCSSTAILHPTCAVKVGSIKQHSIHGTFTWGAEKACTDTHNWLSASSFQLRVRQKENVLSAFICDMELSADKREFEVGDLKSESVFNVQVRAVNQFGEVGKWSELTRFLTLSNVIVKVVEVGEDYATAWWGREGDEVGSQPPSIGSRNSIEQFCLRLEQHPNHSQLLSNPNAQPAVVDEQLFTGSVCVHKMQNLLPGRVYSIYSRYLNIQGDWSPWSSSMFRTGSKTSMINVQAVSHNFILISWEQETDEVDDSLALNKTPDVVNWQVRCVNMATKEESTVVLPEKETSTRIVNLPPNTEFKISARAKTAYGQWGLWGESAYVTTLTTLQVNVDSVGESWIKLNWARADKKYNDSVVRYHVQVSAAETPFRLSKYFTADVTEYRFEDLTSATEYRVSIQACVDDRWQTWSEALSVRTAGPAQVHLVRRGEDFIQIKWSSEFYELNGIDPLDQKYQLKVVKLNTDLATEESIMCQEFANVFGYRITKLASSSRISVQVRAYNAPQDRWGSWCAPETIVTLPSVISFTMIGETCFEVAWQRKPRMVSAVYDTVPVDEDPLAPSEAVMYILRINQVDADGISTPLEKYHFTDEDRPFFIVEGLQPNHRYSAQLCTADSQQTWSPWSAAAVVTTMPTLKLEVLELGEDYCKISWQREEGLEKTVWDESDTKYRIAATSLTLDDAGGAAAEAQLKYFVDGENTYTLRHLVPDSSYRICISAYPKKTNVWGVWSEPVYARTNSSIEVELDAVGEDYAHVSWKRIPPSPSLAQLHPCCDPVYVGTVTHENPTAAKLNEIKNKAIEDSLMSGNHRTIKPLPIYVADASITEFNVKVFAVKDDRDGGEVHRELEYETFLAYDSSTIRIPNLHPSTSYEVGVCACNPKGEWGVMSNVLPFKTTMPTEMVVSEITHTYVRVKWGRGVGETVDDTRVEKIEKYLLKIVGTDDDFCKEVTLPGDHTTYDIQSLSINCCYSLSVKSMHEGSWGHWSNPIYVALRSIDVRLVETSQDWLKLSWANKAIPDGRQKQLFITLIGDGKATTRTLPSGSDTEYVFTDLLPLSVYSVHLLCVEQVPSYIKQGGWTHPTETRDCAPTIPDLGRPTDTNITVALPLVAADYSSFYTDSFAFSTLANIALEIVSVGENFITAKWSREVHAHAGDVLREKDAEYEILCSPVDNQGASVTKRVKGTEATITGLGFNTLFELRVRKVSMLTSAWSKAVSVQTLDKVRVQVGPAGVSFDDMETQVGVGEDFILLNWERGVGKISPQTSFCVRCCPFDDEKEGKEDEFMTAATHYRLTNLQSDRKYKITVRSIIESDGQQRAGEWSDEIVLCTLSPMLVKVVDITEETAEVRWTRRGNAPESHTIGSYHLKVFSLPKAKGSESQEPKVLEERQLMENDPEFGGRSIKLTGLKPDHSYTAMVRASAENSWGAWSDGVTFTTQRLMNLSINLVGEECVFISWGRESKTRRQSTREVQTQGSVETAVVGTCELSVSTVGKDRTHFSKKLPASPNHYRLDGLTPNMQYSFCLRPCYSSGAYGIWCEQLYCCTLAPVTVEVSRIGETFVHVRWQRAPQQRIAARLREQQQQQQHEFEEQQRKLQDEIDAAKQELDDGGVFEKEFLSLQTKGDTPQQVTLEGSAKLEQLLKVQRHQQQKQQQLAKLQELQLLELERVTKYPDGEDMRYEVVITGTADNAADDSSVSCEEERERDKSKPFTFRRRINCGEGTDKTCKMDGLMPHSSYTVIVRAMYNNGYNVLQLVDEDTLFEGRALLSSEEKERERQEAGDQLLWGAWSEKAEMCTLKQISLCVRGVGSTHCVVDWDTGYAAGDVATAISQYQLMVVERDKKKGKPCQDIVIDNPNTSSWTVTGLQVNTQYTVTVRVCYDDERWGLWSNAIAFLTLPALSARVTDVAETAVSLLVWREAQKVDDPQVLLWRPKQSELQLSINDIPSPATFKLDLDTSTLLTLDDLTIDSLYQVKSREVDANGDWREWQKVVEFETLPAAPSKPVLDERRGNVISISWHQRQNREHVQYLYKVEMAYTLGGKKSAVTEHGPFQPVGLLRTTSIRLELLEPVHRCLFRVMVCKEHQRLEGEAQEGQDGYLWSQYSPVAHFHAPSVPLPPTQLKIVNLKETSATVKWKKPENWRSHTNLVYKVYLSSSYNERPVCLGSTVKCFFKMDYLECNTHYRVGCTAESSMGVSQNNHVLHFSTRVLSNQGPLYGVSDNPTSSTLPPRNGLRLPLSEMERLGFATSPTSAAGSPHSATHTELPDELSIRRIKPAALFSPAYSPASTADQMYAGMHSNFLPPVRSPTPAM